MDAFNLILNSVVENKEGEYLGEVIGFEILGNRMYIKTTLVRADDTDDPDDGEKEDIPEPAPLPAEADAASNVRSLFKKVGNDG